MKEIIVVSFAILFAEMCAGIPVGYLEAELTASLGLLWAEVLSEVVGFAAVFLLCFLFARTWAGHAVVRSVVALSVVEMISVCLSLASGAGLPLLGLFQVWLPRRQALRWGGLKFVADGEGRLRLH